MKPGRHLFALLAAALMTLASLPALRAAQAVTEAKAEGSFETSSRGGPVKGAAELSKLGALWDSRGAAGGGEGRLSIGPFVLGHSIDLAVAGDAGSPGLRLLLVREDGGASLELKPRAAPGEAWDRLQWTVPEDWVGTRVRLVAEDRAPGGPWLGVSTPLPVSPRFGDALGLAGLQTWVAILLLLPGLATLPLTGRWGTSRRLVLVMLASATAAYAVFFATFAQPALGRALAWTIAAGSLAGLAAGWRRALAALRLADLAVPLALAVLASIVYVEFGFVSGETGSALTIQQNRFLWNLPADPYLPHLLAQVLASGSPLHPFAGDWLTSDRPPLQAGLDLLVWPFVSRDLGYACVGVAAQGWVWLGFWVFLRSLRVPGAASALVLGCSVFSGFFFVNSFYFWPKLLPAGFLLAGAGLLWEPGRDGTLTLRVAAAAAACFAFALLGHGGSFFGIAGLALVYLAQRQPLAWRPVLLGAVVAGAVLLPWNLYQRFADPPGDRLVKFHLAGHVPVDPRPSLVVIREAYARLTWPQFVDHKLRNVECLFCRRAQWWANTKDAVSLWRQGKVLRAFAVFQKTSRDAGFYHYGQTLGPLLAGLAGLGWAALRRRRGPGYSAGYLCAGIFAATAAVWCLLMFEGESTLIHQGTYLMGACLFAAASLGLAALPGWLLRTLLAVQLAWFWFIWVVPAPLWFDAPDRVLLDRGFAGFNGVGIAASFLLLLVLEAAGRALAREAEAGTSA